MAETKTIPSILLGFMVVEKTAKNDGYIAAFMVTDERGYPLEFRATTPVKPTLVQKTLYGSQLEHYVGVELCSKELIQQSARKPKIVLVPKGWMLDISTGLPITAIALWRSGESMKVEDKRERERQGEIKSGGSNAQPLVYAGRFPDPEREKEVISNLEDCAARFDLVEAFERMRTALQLLAKEDSRFA